MTKAPDTSVNFDGESSKEHRKNMMRVMSEVSLNPANVVSKRQEELAMFMVSELRGMQSPRTFNYEKWIPEGNDLD